MSSRQSVLPVVVLLGLVSLALAACGVEQRLDLGADSDLPPAQRSTAITNGQPHSGHPAVGILIMGTSGMCTATLVGKKTVLTAAHCIKNGQSHTFKVGSGSYSAVSVHSHPSYSGSGGSHDIAVVRLSSAPPVAPAAIATTAPSVGTGLTLVGYGVTNCTVNSYGQLSCTKDSGIKRMATNSIAAINSIEFSFVGSGGGMGSTCKGDSGGPAFAQLNGQEVVVGVTSRGAMPCGTKGIDTRVDAFASWISSQAGGDVNKGGTTPPPPPPPKDEQPPQVTITTPVAGATVGLATTVKASISDNKGVVRAELFVDGTRIRTVTKAPYVFPVNLKAGSRHLRVVGQDAAGNRGEAQVTVTAQDSSTPPSTGPTDPGQAPPADPSTPGAFGASCSGPEDCQSGLCARDEGGMYCTRTCDPSAVSNCPGGGGCFPTNSPGTHVCGLPAAGQAPQDGAYTGELVGGCSVASARDSGLSWLPLALLALGAVLLRRRR